MTPPAASNPVDEFFDKLELIRATSSRRSYAQIERWTKDRYPNDYLSHSTVHGWFKNRLVPKWEPFCKLLECFEQEPSGWLDSWHRADRWQESGGKLEPPPNARTDIEAVESADDTSLAHASKSRPLVLVVERDRDVSLASRRRRRIVASIVVVVVLACVGAYLLLRSAPTDPGSGTGATLCLQVAARTTRVFTAPRGDETWTTWTTGTKFWADVEIQNQRYRTPLSNGRDGWITSNPKFVAPADGCPLA
jgi:hypothetical protein